MMIIVRLMRPNEPTSCPGNRIPIFDNGEFNLAFGTSAAAPMVASLVALLNDHRLRNGHPRLGFINSLLYSQKARTGFNDITKGSNPGCSTKGFKATKGYVFRSTDLPLPP